MNSKPKPTKQSAQSVKTAPAGQDSKTNTETKKHPVWKLLIALIILAVVIIAFWLLFRGKTTVSGAYPENVKDESLECISAELTYPKLGTINPAPQATELKITVVSNGTDPIKSIGIRNLMTFQSTHEASSAETVAHANFNIGLHGIGRDTNAFENKFSIINEKLLVSVFAKTSAEITDYTKSYFMIQSDKLPESLADYRTEYERQGFTCRMASETQTGESEQK